MDKMLLAFIFQEGGNLISNLLKTRPRKREATSPNEPHYEIIAESEEKATSIEAGCVPCSVGHLGTCSGLLNEAMRFARKDGINSSNVIDRVNICMDELNALERVDLRPEMITNLSPWEKELANKALKESRAIRHHLESLSSADDLEKAAANTQTARQEIGREWFQQRLAKMPKEAKTKLVEKTIEKLGEE